MALTLLIHSFCGLVVLVLIAGSLLNLSRHPHWFIRGWDFPRVQIVGLAAVAWATAMVTTALSDRATWWDARSPVLWITTGTISIALWHAYRIVAYTPLAPTQVVRTRHPNDAQTLRMVVSNVQMENMQTDLWMDVIGNSDPDILVAVEVNDRWMKSLEPLVRRYPEVIAQPQDNYYGMMLLSKFPIARSAVHYLVQDDVPSIEAIVRIPQGQLIRVVGVHPRPPEPLRDTDSNHRDAELAVLAKRITEAPMPTIVGGDLNDVAWSYTTRLFLRLSHLLDPRRGRGFYNTFCATSWLWKFPLDHVFHSNDFSLRKLQRLDFVGSDHFPMLIDLQYEPAVQDDQESMEADEDDHKAAEETLEREFSDE